MTSTKPTWFDTAAYESRLIAAGVTPEVARAHSEALMMAFDQALSDVQFRNARATGAIGAASQLTSVGPERQIAAMASTCLSRALERIWPMLVLAMALVYAAAMLMVKL